MKTPYTVVRSGPARRDLNLIYSHLVESHIGFGHPPDEAHDRAAERLQKILAAMEGLGRAPFQGTLRQDLMPGLRQVTKEQAIFYFTTDEPAHRLTVLAIFFGGQDHRRHMLMRLSGEG